MRFKVVNYSQLEIRLDTLHIYRQTDRQTDRQTNKIAAAYVLHFRAISHEVMILENENIIVVLGTMIFAYNRSGCI